MYDNRIKNYRDVVAICDSDLIEKTFEEGNFQLEVKESFFKGEETSKEELTKILNNLSQEDATFNIVGEESIKRIQGVPFALVLL